MGSHSGEEGIKEPRVAIRSHEAFWVDAGPEELVPHPKSILGFASKKYFTIQCPECGAQMWRYSRVHRQKCSVCRAERIIHIQQKVAFCIFCHRQDSVD